MSPEANIVPPPPPASPRDRVVAPPVGGRAKVPPPEWVIERVIKRIGVAPATAKRGLDWLAEVRGFRTFFKVFTSVWTGILWIFLIGVYVGIGSGFANLRAHFEMTDLQFFDAMPMRILIALLALSLTIVTLRRIPLTLYKLGVWTVHIGILTLLFGCVWYFSQKTEGSVRIFLNQEVGSVYDVTERALYAYNMKPDGKADQAGGTMTLLPELPIYNEHIARFHNALDMPVAGAALTGLNPALKDATLKVVGYYPYAEMVNNWGPDDDAEATPEAPPSTPLPTAPHTAATPLPAGHHAALIGFTANGRTDGKYFVADIPAQRIYDGPERPFTMEYLYNPTAEQMADVRANISGTLGLTVRIPKLHIDETFATPDDKAVAIKGSGYTVAAGDQMPMTLASKGYEGAFSNNERVHITRKNADGSTFAFDRVVLSHFPEVSPDFVTEPDGQQKRIQERVDHDIDLRFIDNQRDQIWVVENSAAAADKRFELFHRKVGGGEAEHFWMEMNQPVPVKVGDLDVKFVVLAETDHAVEVAEPQIVPVQERERGQTAMDAMQFSIVELSLSRGKAIQDRHFFVPFVQFAEIGPAPLGREPTVVNIPGVGKIGFLLSTARRELPNTIKLTGFEAVKYPGADHSYEDYVSHMEVADKKTGKKSEIVARLNEPAKWGGNYYFQSGWDGNDVAGPGVRFSILGIGNRPGLRWMEIGALLMIVGIGYAFYVKPILLNKKKKWLAEWAGGK